MDALEVDRVAAEIDAHELDRCQHGFRKMMMRVTMTARISTGTTTKVITSAAASLDGTA
jgi:hypothetical protein